MNRKQNKIPKFLNQEIYIIKIQLSFVQNYQNGMSRLKQSNLTSLTQSKKRVQQKSLQEQVYQMQIQNIQAQRLRKTFRRICGDKMQAPNGNFKIDKQQTANRNPQFILLSLRPKDKFDKKDIIRVLNQLSFPFSKPQVDQWIWQVDEDLDGSINQYEFTLMYKRCIFDKTWLQPRNLFNLVQFLMYDLAGRGKITVEDTLQLIYVRHPEQLEEHIKDIFQERQKTEDGQQREVFFEQYLKQMRKRDLKKRQKLQQQRKAVTKVKLTKEQQD